MMIDTLLIFFRRYIFNTIVDVLFPPLCYICESYLESGQKIICKTCWKNIPTFKGPLDKSLSKRSFDNLFILFEFEITIRILIHLLKYKRHLTLASYFAREAVKRFNLSHLSYDQIIPVPLFKTRRRERGYNQSEEIAHRLADLIHVPVKSAHLLRIRSTSTQTRMSREEREQNVSGAFKCDVNLKKHRILLIDDVITTGSTTEACLNILKTAGAQTVDVLVIAHPLENES
jgi:ComF family protein